MGLGDGYDLLSTEVTCGIAKAKAGRSTATYLRTAMMLRLGVCMWFVSSILEWYCLQSNNSKVIQ